MSNSPLPQLPQPRLLPLIVAGFLLFAPAGLLGLAYASQRAAWPTPLVAGLIVTVLLALLLLRFTGSRPFRLPLTAAPAVAAVISLWLAGFELRDRFMTFGMGALVVLGALIFAGYALAATGAPALRQACRLAAELAGRREWPATLDACRHVPEVKALREALRDEAAPAMSLLTAESPQVRIAALAALEYRRGWRRGQPEMVLNIAKAEPLPEIRAAAMLALGGVNQRLIVEEMAGCLRDPSPIVRQAAIDALLWDCDKHWIWIRNALHEAIGDPRFSQDGPIHLSMGAFSEQAASDLAAWSTEAGSLGVRATQTLALHYANQLNERADPKLLDQITELVASPRTAAILRIELSQLLRNYGQFSPELLERLMDPASPAPLRLLAVEIILQSGPNEQAVEVLRQIARQPNRELALNAAVVVQRYLQVDLNLALGQPPPALHTRQAAEVTRRVIQWAEHGTVPLRRSSHVPLPGSRTAAPSAMKKKPAAKPDSLLAVPPDTNPPPPPPDDGKLARLEWD